MRSSKVVEKALASLTTYLILYVLVLISLFIGNCPSGKFQGVKVLHYLG